MQGLVKTKVALTCFLDYRAARAAAAVRGQAQRVRQGQVLPIKVFLAERGQRGLLAGLLAEAAAVGLLKSAKMAHPVKVATAETDLLTYFVLAQTKLVQAEAEGHHETLIKALAVRVEAEMVVLTTQEVAQTQRPTLARAAAEAQTDHPHRAALVRAAL